MHQSRQQIQKTARETAALTLLGGPKQSSPILNGKITVEALQGTAIRGLQSTRKGNNIDLGTNMLGAGT